MKNHADLDGMVHCAAAHISIDLEQPLRTVQGALQRLEQQGEVYFIERGKFVVVTMASVNDIDAD
jgi:DNA-binding transcriptional regulator YhcF (GntR family)